MTEVVQATEAELAGLMAELDTAVTKLQGLKDIKDRKTEEPLTRKVYKSAKNALSTLKTETGRLDDPTQKSIYTKKVKEYDGKLTNYDKDIRACLKVEKAAKPVTSGFDKIMGPDGGDFQSAAQVMDAVHRAQDENMDRLTRVLATQRQIEDVGLSIVETLQKQTEDIAQINKDLATMQSQVNRAKGDLIYFARQMAGDKCFLALLAMIIIGIIILVFWKTYTKRTAAATPATTTVAPTPSPTEADGSPITPAATTRTTTTTTTTTTTQAPTTTLLPPALSSKGAALQALAEVFVKLAMSE